MLTPVEVWAPAFLEHVEQPNVSFAPDPPGFSLKPENWKNVDPPVADLKAVPKFDRTWLGNIDNILRYINGWGLCCILCEGKNLSNRQDHHDQHMRELDQFIKSRQKKGKTAAEQKRLDNLAKARAARGKKNRS